MLLLALVKTGKDWKCSERRACSKIPKILKNLCKTVPFFLQSQASSSEFLSLTKTDLKGNFPVSNSYYSYVILMPNN